LLLEISERAHLRFLKILPPSLYSPVTHSKHVSTSARNEDGSIVIVTKKIAQSQLSEAQVRGAGLRRLNLSL